MNATLSDIWTWMIAKCNADEIAAYIGVTRYVALAMMEAARGEYLDGYR